MHTHTRFTAWYLDNYVKRIWRRDCLGCDYFETYRE